MRSLAKAKEKALAARKKAAKTARLSRHKLNILMIQLREEP